MARVGEEFPVACLGGGGDIRLIPFITDPGPIRKILTHLGNHPDAIPLLKLRPCQKSPPKNPIHHLLRPGLPAACCPPLGIQGIAHLLKRAVPAVGRLPSERPDSGQRLGLAGESAQSVSRTLSLGLSLGLGLCPREPPNSRGSKNPRKKCRRWDLNPHALAGNGF
jgi:hypothetical protein